MTSCCEPPGGHSGTVGTNLGMVCPPRQRNDTWQNARWKQREEEKREQRSGWVGEWCCEWKETIDCLAVRTKICKGFDKGLIFCTNIFLDLRASKRSKQAFHQLNMLLLDGKKNASCLNEWIGALYGPQSGVWPQIQLRKSGLVVIPVLIVGGKGLPGKCEVNGC